MQILETREDGTLLCVLTAEEAALIGHRPAPMRKWYVRASTWSSESPGWGRKSHKFVIHAATREEAEREGERLALEERKPGSHVIDVGAKDVTGMHRTPFGWS